MAKKHWIYIKRGLSEDPKHRNAMGECIWLYMHIIDRADWEKGIAYDWKDEAEAADMGMPLRTLREQRRKLDDLGYISCVQLKHNQNIIIKRWINPRDYGGKVMNSDGIEGDIGMEPLTDNENKDDSQDYTKGYTKGSSQDVTPTSNSESKSSSKKGDLLDGILAFQKPDDKPILDDFERSLGFGALPWYSNTTWEKFRRFVIRTAGSNPDVWRDYAAWRMDGGKYKAFSNRKIRENPAAFMDTGYPEYEACKMYRPQYQQQAVGMRSHKL
jgi:hypothetical protein